jgi:hypothetical protein
MFVPAYNINPAEAFGKLKILLPPRAPFTDSSQIIPQLVGVLNYSFKKGDCLLLLGDPVVQASVVALVAAQGDFRVLRWDKNIGKYIPVVVSTKLAA